MLAGGLRHREQRYRGTPVQIDLGFDASEAFHRYAIEWEPTGIRWFVDGKQSMSGRAGIPLRFRIFRCSS